MASSTPVPPRPRRSPGPPAATRPLASPHVRPERSLRRAAVPRQPRRAGSQPAATGRATRAALTSGPGSPLVLSVVPESPPLYKRCGARKKRWAPSVHRAIAGCHGSRVSVRLALRELSGISEICPRTGAVSPNAVASPP